MARYVRHCESQREEQPPAGESRVRVQFGRRAMEYRQASALQAGTVVDLDCDVDEDVEVYADGRLFARGEAVVVDGRLAVRLREVFGDGVGAGATVARDCRN